MGKAGETLSYYWKLFANTTTYYGAYEYFNRNTSIQLYLYVIYKVNGYEAFIDSR